MVPIDLPVQRGIHVRTWKLALKLIAPVLQREARLRSKRRAVRDPFDLVRLEKAVAPVLPLLLLVL